MIEMLIKERAIAKARPRFNFRTKRTYTPEKTRKYESMIKKEFYKQYDLKDCIQDKPVQVKIKAKYKIPKSYTKKQKEDCIGQPYQKKPDCDNIAKAILDALNGLAYRDDSQVVKIKVEKLYDENEDSIYINIAEYKGE